MKNLKKLGKVLSTKEQKNVNGGFFGKYNENYGLFMACANKSIGDTCNGWYSNGDGFSGTCQLDGTIANLLICV